MKARNSKFAVVAAVFSLLTFSAVALAVKPPDAGNGGGSGNEPPDFGDLIILYRDAYGVPILTAESCQQPVAFPSALCSAAECVVDGDPDLVLVEPGTCAVKAGCESCTREVEFERLNEARSPDSVFLAQLEDATVKLATADCISLDPAGRLVASTVADTEVLTATIDSPLQNLAVYRQLVSTGYLGAQSAPLALPGTELDTAARGYGAALSKSGEANVDLTVYLNEILGLTEQDSPLLPWGRTCIDVKEEVKGLVQMVEKCFLNYGSYNYERTANFGGLPAPAYIPEVSPTPGSFEYLGLYSAGTPDLFYIIQGPIMGAVFADETSAGSNIGYFTQAADDTRAVIEFMHNNPLPIGYETPVPCEASGETTYDVSISDVSGLQVPVRMVAGTEGREFSVTVVNGGPDAAVGNVEVTAEDANGDPIPTFPRSFDFTLLAGNSQSWTEAFTVDYKTTITWVATAVAEFDVNPDNNSVTETTVVTGGGRGRP